MLQYGWKSAGPVVSMRSILGNELMQRATQRQPDAKETTGKHNAAEQGTEKVRSYSEVDLYDSCLHHSCLLLVL